MKHNKEKFVKQLLEWYKKEQRILPWREQQNSYYIWISEIMLQQTRVEAVKKYFIRMVSTLKNLEEFANCEEETLYKLWEGLGYYNRVRNMQKCAKICCEKYEGKLPKTYAQLIELPGIGPYTAGAIASIAHQEKVCAVDGNVMRVFSRVLNINDDIAKEKTKKLFQLRIQEYLPNEVGDFNQAVMELGALICVPNGNPRCNICPIQSECIAYQKGTQLQLPIKSKLKKRKIEKYTVVRYRCKNKIHIQKRAQQGLLANLYQFDMYEGHKKKKELQDLCSVTIEKIKPLEKSKHIFSHIEWHMIGYEVIVNEMWEEGIWVEEQEIFQHYAIPTAFQAYTKDLKKEKNNQL